MEITECSIVNACAPVINQNSVQSGCINVLHFQLFWTLSVTFEAKNSVRRAPASSAVSHWSCNARTANYHLHGSRKRNGAQRKVKVSLGRSMMLALELQWLVKSYVLGQFDLIREEIKAVAIAIIKLHLSEGISQSVSQSISQSVSRKFCWIRNWKNLYYFGGRING